MPTPKSFERIVAVCGIVLIATAAAARQSWLDRHFLPSFFIPRQWYVLIETSVRLGIAAAGLALVLGRSRTARLLTRAPSMTLSIGLAAAIAIAAGELVLRVRHPRPTGWLVPEEEPRRQSDAYLGWVLAPGRTGLGTIGGRTVEYAIDAAGYRVRSADEVADVSRPAILFAGESVMFG